MLLLLLLLEEDELLELEDDSLLDELELLLLELDELLELSLLDELDEDEELELLDELLELDDSLLLEELLIDEEEEEELELTLLLDDEELVDWLLLEDEELLLELAAPNITTQFVSPWSMNAYGKADRYATSSALSSRSHIKTWAISPLKYMVLPVSSVAPNRNSYVLYPEPISPEAFNAPSRYSAPFAV